MRTNRSQLVAALRGRGGEEGRGGEGGEGGEGRGGERSVKSRYLMRVS